MQASPALPLGIEAEVGLGEKVQVALPDFFEAVVEEVCIEDILHGDALAEQTGDHLVQERGLAAASRPDADERLAGNQPVGKTARHTGEAHLPLGLQQHILNGLD